MVTTISRYLQLTEYRESLQMASNDLPPCGGRLIRCVLHRQRPRRHELPKDADLPDRVPWPAADSLRRRQGNAGRECERLRHRLGDAETGTLVFWPHPPHLPTLLLRDPYRARHPNARQGSLNETFHIIAVAVPSRIVRHLIATLVGIALVTSKGAFGALSRAVGQVRRKPDETARELTSQLACVSIGVLIGSLIALVIAVLWPTSGGVGAAITADLSTGVLTAGL